MALPFHTVLNSFECTLLSRSSQFIVLDIARMHVHWSITQCKDGNTHSNCRELKRGYMILEINLVDSKIMTMLAYLFVKIEQVRFFPNTVIYKRN